MNFIGKIIGGFNNIISFLSGLFQSLFNLLGSGFNALLDFIEKPLSLLFYFLDGVFYFFSKLFDVVVLVIQIFVSLFQFIGALFMGVFRTIHKWIIPNLSDHTSFPSASHAGFQAVMDIVAPTGLTTVVPLVAIAFCWFYFVIKMIGLFGGSIYISPFGNGGNK